MTGETLRGTPTVQLLRFNDQTHNTIILIYEHADVYTGTDCSDRLERGKKKFTQAKLHNCRLQGAVGNPKLLEYDTTSATVMFTFFLVTFSPFLLFGGLCDGKQFL